MKRLFTFTVLIMLLTALSAQESDNELHAFYKERNHTVIPQWNTWNAEYGSLFDNYNITNEEAPQNEPSVRISRVNPDIIVAAWRDFREGWQSPDIVRRIGYSYSHDGGLTWSESKLLPDPEPNHLSQSDPVVMSDSQGFFYISSTSRQPVTNYNREMLIYRSADNGENFELYSVAVPGSGLQGEDKEWIFVDPVETNPTYDNMFIIWRSFGPSNGIKFRKSADHGLTWSSTVNVSDVSTGQGANVASGVNGEIFAVWLNIGIMFDVSNNGGQSFGQDHMLANLNVNEYYSFPYIAVDYSNLESRGNVYVVWADNRTGTEDIWFQRSEDNGQSWLPNPIRVNDVATNDQYWPMIMCDTNGMIAVIYYDDRTQAGLLGTYLAVSEDEGNTWTNIKLNSAPFFGFTPNSDVRFGDYIGVDMLGGKVIPVWTDDRTFDDNQEIYTAVMDIHTGIPKVTNKPLADIGIYPQPVKDQARIDVTLLETGHVRLEIRDPLGKVVDVINEENLTAGTHSYQWHANRFPPGMYFLTLKTKEQLISRKMMVVH
ncbi:MAG: T9SS type A sorting domain-containing protein [Bacteroidetes bacterium]|nr:T9SS type A sorting domain-containing protein [Bacteroidota bacterium]